MSETIVKGVEIFSQNLRALYQSYGYLPYKMNKFEEYDLYARNKEFLDGARIVTFNDTDGKLLALKPDITLSIVKNDQEGAHKRKVYYHETVYRAQKDGEGFKELLQTGLECIGALELYDEYETAYLAAASLAAFGKPFVLDISHRGVLTSVIEEICSDREFVKTALKLVAEKNAHGIDALASAYAVNVDKLKALVGCYGAPEKVLPVLEGLVGAEAIKGLKTLCELLSGTEFKSNIRLDISVVGSGNYYDGVVFNGFVDGVGEAVLSGGRYDGLLARMGKSSGAIGFAVYLDRLENISVRHRTEDVDAVVLYDDSVDAETLAKTVRSLVQAGASVSAQRVLGALRCKRVIDLRGGAKC